MLTLELPCQSIAPNDRLPDAPAALVPIFITTAVVVLGNVAMSVFVLLPIAPAYAVSPTQLFKVSQLLFDPP